MRLNLNQVTQNIKQHFGRGLVRIYAVQQLAAVKIEHRFAFAFVSFLPIADDIHVRIVEAVLFEGAALEAFDQFVHVSAAQIENADDLERVFQHLRLSHIPRNTVEHERVLIRMEAASLGAGLDELPPEWGGGLVRHQFTSAGILQKNLANGAVGLEAAKDLAAGAMEEVGDGAQDFALGPFSGSGSAEQQDGAIFHRRWRVEGRV